MKDLNEIKKKISEKSSTKILGEILHIKGKYLKDNYKIIYYKLILLRWNVSDK